MIDKIELENIELYSKKNSKRITTLRNGRQILLSSQKYLENEQIILELLSLHRKQWKNMIKNAPIPLKIHFVIYRKTRKIADTNNILQGLFDCMVEAGWLEDDNGWIFCPIYHPLQYDKNNPRVIMWLDEPNLTLQEQFNKYIKDK